MKIVKVETFAIQAQPTDKQAYWGSRTWGTWWQWDGRMTSMLVLLFLYFGYIALANAGDEKVSV